MIINSFYYLAYPDSDPADELIASSEVYVEVSGTGGSTESFDDTYSLFVHTVGYIQLIIAKNKYFAMSRSLVVERFNDAAVRAALEAILPSIDSIAIKK